MEISDLYSQICTSYGLELQTISIFIGNHKAVNAESAKNEELNNMRHSCAAVRVCV